MAAAVAMETGALCPAPRVFTERTVLRPDLLSRFPARSFKLNSASLELGLNGGKAVLSFRLWRVSTSLLPDYSNPPLLGSRAGVGLRERTEPFSCLLFGAFSVNVL